jgi:hypothetical protein
VTGGTGLAVENGTLGGGGASTALSGAAKKTPQGIEAFSSLARGAVTATVFVSSAETDSSATVADGTADIEASEAERDTDADCVTRLRDGDPATVGVPPECERVFRDRLTVRFVELAVADNVRDSVSVGDPRDFDVERVIVIIGEAVTVLTDVCVGGRLGVNDRVSLLDFELVAETDGVAEVDDETELDEEGVAVTDFVAERDAEGVAGRDRVTDGVSGVVPDGEADVETLTVRLLVCDAEPVAADVIVGVFVTVVVIATTAVSERAPSDLVVAPTHTLGTSLEHNPSAIAAGSVMMTGAPLSTSPNFRRNSLLAGLVMPQQSPPYMAKRWH